MPSKKAKIILGIDPGSQFTGFGILRVCERKIEHVSHGLIALPVGRDFHDRIGILAYEIETLLKRIEPDIAVVERIFLGKNADSAFKLGHARGVVIAAAIRASAHVVEYAARSVKKGITGTGAASKDQVQMVLFAALGIRQRVQTDASDALALAYYHAQNLEVLRQMDRQAKRNGEAEL